MQRQTVRIGTRKSKLALWQANYVADLLDKAGFQPQLIPIETKGDKILNVTLSKIGSKGVFTEELEVMLQRKKVDIAVHSAKDLQSSLPAGFQVLAICERALPDDVILSNKDLDVNQPGLTLGTSSTRRVALLKHFYPNIKTVDVRGNLQTRIEKLSMGSIDGIVLAYAGVERMNYQHLVRYWFDIERFIPPAGQGAIAIECHESIDKELKTKIYEATNHPKTEKVVTCERAFLKELEGGCSVPVSAYAIEEDNQIFLSGSVVSLDGKQRITRSMKGDEPIALGKTLGQEVLDSGGRKILNEIKSFK